MAHLNKVDFYVYLHSTIFILM